MAPAEANSFRFSLLPASPIFSWEKQGGDKPFALYSPAEVLVFGLHLTFWIDTYDGWVTWFRLSELRVWISAM